MADASPRVLTRPVLGWCLYDWANSAFATVMLAAVLPIYFTAIAPERMSLAGTLVPASSLWAYGLALSAGTVALLAPALGAVADAGNRRKAMLAVFAGTGILASGALAAVGPGQWLACLVLFGLAHVGFAGGNVFYNAFLPVVAPARHLDRVSGWGYALGYVGGGLVLAGSMGLMARPGILGLADTAAAARASFLGVAAWWFAFSLPLFLWVEEPGTGRGIPWTRAVVQGFRGLYRTLTHVRQHGQAFRFLVAYLIYNDGVQAVIALATLYGSTELRLPPQTLLAVLLAIQFVAFPSALALARLAEAVGPRRVLMGTLVGWMAIVFLGSRLETAAGFWALGLAVGLILGGTQALSRSLYARFVPEGQGAEFFGFFAIGTKFAAVAGPFTFGLVGHLTGSGRSGVLALGGFFLAGLLILLTVKEPGGSGPGRRSP